MLLGGLLALGSLTACSNDSTLPQLAVNVPTSVKIDYSATVSQQLLDVATVTVHFIGDNGQVASEQMTSTTWAKSVTIPLPTKAGMNIQPTLKGEVAEGEYTIAAKGQMSYTRLDQNGQQLNPGIIEKTPEMEGTFYADGIGQYLGAIAANCQVASTFAKDYSVTETTITWGANTVNGNNTQNTGISNDGATGDNR